MEEKHFSEQDVSDNKGLGILMGFFDFLFFLPLVMGEKKNSEYLKHRANQSLIVFICGIISGVVGKIPLIGWIVGGVIGLAVFVLWLINFINACQGNGKELPFIGQIKIL
ncbi:MAG: DUF4870 domain-containing protein [Huintestinicola sp.]